MKDGEVDSHVVEGRVKWYDAVKGYGFVVPESGGRDVMVHASCVRAFGRVTLEEGAEIKLSAVESPRGLQADRLLLVEGSEPGEPVAAQPPGFSDTRPSEFTGIPQELGPLLPARVKWFDKQKGFGFLNVFGDPEDIFVHMETVRRCGFQNLSSGEGMAIRTFRGPRGMMVAELRLWESAAVEGPEDSI